MTITPTIPQHYGGPTLEAFKQAASEGPTIYLDGERLTVLSSGRSPAGHSVDWVAPDGDAAGALIEAIGHATGPGLSRAIAHTLGLSSAPGKPLSSRTVEQAVSMAETGRNALEGVNFMTRLSFSAQGGGPAFEQACALAGLKSADVGAADRLRIDQAMQSRMEATGAEVVSAGQAMHWMVELLAEHPGR